MGSHELHVFRAKSSPVVGRNFLALTGPGPKKKVIKGLFGASTSAVEEMKFPENYYEDPDKQHTYPRAAKFSHYTSASNTGISTIGRFACSREANPTTPASLAAMADIFETPGRP